MIDIKRNRYLDPIAEEWLNNVKKFFNTTRRPYIIQGAKRKYFNSYASKLRYECLTLIPQHFDLTLFISSCATRSCSGFCHVRFFTYLSVAIRKQAKIVTRHGKGTNKI